MRKNGLSKTESKNKINKKIKWKLDPFSRWETPREKRRCGEILPLPAARGRASSLVAVVTWGVGLPFWLRDWSLLLSLSRSVYLRTRDGQRSEKRPPLGRPLACKDAGLLPGCRWTENAFIRQSTRIPVIFFLFFYRNEFFSDVLMRCSLTLTVRYHI